MTDPLLERVLGSRYRVERALGQGGMGAVYVATDLSHGGEVALKVLLDASDPRDVERLRLEAFAAASLAHPCIVRCMDFSQAAGGDPAFLVMELLAGTSLARFVAERRALTNATAIHVTLQMLDALSAAHRAGILHRDIKPANVVVLDSGDRQRPAIKLVDFGIAKLMNDESRHTTTGTLLGTPAYMAPEQLRGERATPATDLYSVGVCLYEMLAGARPFVGAGGELVAEILRGTPPALPVDEGLAAVVRRAMAPRSGDRFASAEEMSAALKAFSGDAPVRSGAARARVFVLSAVLASVLAAVATLAIVVWSRKTTLAPAASASYEAPAAPPSQAPPSQAPPASAPVTNDDTAPIAGDAGLASRSGSGARMVRCICATGPRALCAKPQWGCACVPLDENVSGMVLGSPRRGAKPLRREADGERPSFDGAPCQGFIHLGSDDETHQAVSVAGRWACQASCDDEGRVRAVRMAVPGTPCVGYLETEPRQGVYRPWLD